MQLLVELLLDILDVVLQHATAARADKDGSVTLPEVSTLAPRAAVQVCPARVLPVYDGWLCFTLALDQVKREHVETFTE